jgi:hypothetical protein
VGSSTFHRLIGLYGLLLEVFLVAITTEEQVSQQSQCITNKHHRSVPSSATGVSTLPLCRMCPKRGSDKDENRNRSENEIETMLRRKAPIKKIRKRSPFLQCMDVTFRKSPDINTWFQWAPLPISVVSLLSQCSENLCTFRPQDDDKVQGSGLQPGIPGTCETRGYVKIS